MTRKHNQYQIWEYLVCVAYDNGNTTNINFESICHKVQWMRINLKFWMQRVRSTSARKNWNADTRFIKNRPVFGQQARFIEEDRMWDRVEKLMSENSATLQKSMELEVRITSGSRNWPHANDIVLIKNTGNIGVFPGTDKTTQDARAHVHHATHLICHWPLPSSTRKCSRRFRTSIEAPWQCDRRRSNRDPPSAPRKTRYRMVWNTNQIVTSTSRTFFFFFCNTFDCMT